MQAKEFDLTIVTSPLGGATDSLPNDIIRLAMPLESCNGATVVPRPSLVRLDRINTDGRSLTTKVSGGFAGNRNNARLIGRQIREHLASVMVGPEFSAEQPSANVAEVVSEYVRGAGSERTVIVYSTRLQSTSTVSGSKAYRSVDSVLARVFEAVCGRSITDVVVIRSGLGDQVASHADHADEPAAAAPVSDWMVTFDAIKARVYGMEHHEAFDLLQKAATNAIAAGQSKYMLDLLREEASKLPMRRLASHNEWHAIVHALEKADPLLLKGDKH